MGVNDLLEKYPALSEIIEILSRLTEVWNFKYDKQIIFAVNEIPHRFLEELIKPKKDERKEIILENVVLSQEESIYQDELKKLEAYAVEICYDTFKKIIYVVVKRKFFSETLYYILTNNFFKIRYIPEIEKCLVDAITRYFRDYLLSNLMRIQPNIKIEIKKEVVHPDDRLIDQYRKLFLNKLNQIINKYTKIIKEVQQQSFKNALKILQSKKILKILPNGVDISVDIIPEYIVYENKRYVFKKNKDYCYKYVRIRLYTNEEMQVTGAKVVWWDENKRGKLVHPQININDREVCLGELKGRDVYYVVENIENMLKTWNLDSPYENTIYYLLQKYNVEDKEELVEKLTSGESGEDVWSSGLNDWE